MQTVTQSEIDTLLKAMQSELKHVSVNTLLMAQLEALKCGWNATAEVVDLHRLGGRFAQQHNVKSDSRSFLGLLHRGMQFAMQEPPNKLDFLHTIEPFLTRASNDDVKGTSEHKPSQPRRQPHCKWTLILWLVCVACLSFFVLFSARAFERLGTHCLSLVAPEDRVEDEWNALQTFADAINKKIGRAVMRQDTHTTKTADAIDCFAFRRSLLLLSVALCVCVFQS